jgi:AbrB family looped-hinge helix DNA binding protein
METTRISSKGQVVLPSAMRRARNWGQGTVLNVVETAEGILLKTRKPFPPTRIEDVFGSAKYRGRPKTLDEMAAAVRAEARRASRRT